MKKPKKSMLPTEVFIAWKGVSYKRADGAGDEMWLEASVLDRQLIEGDGPTEIGIYELKGIRRLSLKAVEEE